MVNFRFVLQDALREGELGEVCVSTANLLIQELLTVQHQLLQESWREQPDLSGRVNSLFLDKSIFMRGWRLAYFLIRQC